MPIDRLVEIDAPLPIEPSMLEIQLRLPLSWLVEAVKFKASRLE